MEKTDAIQDYKPIKIADSEPIINNEQNINSASFNEISNILNYEKYGDIIESELNEFESLSTTDKQKVDEAIEEEIGFDINDIGTNKISDIVNESQSLDSEEEIIEESDLEDFFDSAEFVIFIFDLAVVWGTNLYLKKEGLDSINSEAFNKTKREQKQLVKAWAGILKKHDVRMGVEIQLLFALGSTYGIKIKAIIKEQKLKKELEIEKNKNKPLKKVNKKNIDKDTFKLNKEEKILELKEEKKDSDKKDNDKKNKITKENFRV